ncbi:MAG: PTS system mannose/fructose/sorbose family transporter subunit IID, partial [Erysipelotrichaceae bacterium]|nr:PTS system mannose/fructose/sorbose family transporter subunit IID [Erysipelotrichaceae bacterium]
MKKMTMSSNTFTDKLTRKELKQIFIRSCQLDISWDYERQQHIAYAYAMTPVIRKLYPGEENKAKRIAALKRGLEFMAITPQLSTLLMGINAAMEEENSNNDEFDGNAINAVKTSLMGPLAGIGDSLSQFCIAPLFSTIFASLALQGVPVAPLLFLLAENITLVLIKLGVGSYGRKLGTDL